MKPNVDLTEGRDFRDKISSGRTLKLPKWTNKCLPRPNQILRKAGIKTFQPSPFEFPPSDRCECCGRPKPPWRNLCKQCDGEICTPEEVKTKGLPRNPEMISNPRVLRV